MTNLFNNGVFFFCLSDRMRRSQWNHNYSPLPDDLLEETNEQLTSELKDKIHALKSLSIDIGQEVKYQDKVCLLYTSRCV